jgi:transmembrane sensor
VSRHANVDSSIEQQAADWFLLMQSEQLPNEAQLQAFLDWLKNPLAEQAYTQCESIWELSGELKSDSTIAASRESNIFESSSNLIHWWKHSQPTVRYALQLSCLLAVTLLFLWGGQLTTQAQYDIYQTATGQQKTVTLADGSQMTLNTSSEVHVSYRNDSRRVILESGEVLFDVAKDKKRPFSVIAGNGEITALGTMFNVFQSSDKSSVEVALIEGKISVHANIHTDAKNTSPQKQVLLASESTRYTASGIAPIQKINDIDRLIQWKEGRLNFSDATLAEVIQQVNRYTINKIVIDDPQLINETIDAYFIIGDTQALLLALKETLNIRWRYQADRISLYRAPPEGTTPLNDAQ